jgi:hypothetical protein
MPGRRLGALFCALLVPVLSAADGKQTRAELAKRGKAASAFVVGGTGTGTAFCVHPSGLFVTNEHVVRGGPAGKGVKLVLEAGLKGQRVLDARVVRTDPANDLALVRVDGEKDLPALPVGPSDGVTELAEVIAFGFPFGTALSADQKDYPSVSVNVCAVSALRHKGGKLDRVDLNGAVNPGQSGGPLLDQDGKVVGVIVSGIRGSGIFQAIPSAHLSRFLAKPEIDFTPPKLDLAAAGKPVTFKVRVDSPLPAEKPHEVELIATGVGPERRVKMELRGGAFEATLVPAPPTTGPKMLDVTARFAGGTVVVASIPDREVKVAGTAVPLRDVTRVRRLPSGCEVTRTTGSATGPLTGLEAVEVRIGGRAVSLDFGAADSVEVSAPGEPSRLDLAFVVTVGGAEVGRSTAAVTIAGANPARPAVAAMKSAELGDGKVVRKLPTTFSDVCVGGNGKYLILHLAQQRKLAVFDVPAARVAGFISVDEDDVKFAAGLDKLIVALPSKGILQRWNLATLEREVTVQAGAGTIKHVVMGHASAGPVLVHTANAPGTPSVRTEFLDLRTLRPIAVREPAGRSRGIGVDTDGYVRASADGQTFAFWRLHISPQGISTLVITGDEVRRSYDHHSAGHLMPSPDGKIIHTARGRYTAECKAIDDPRNGHNYANFTLPAVHGNFHLGLKLGDGKEPVNVFMGDDKRPVARLDILDGLETDGWGREAVGLDKRVFLIPEAKVVVVLPKTNDAVVLRRFDLDEALEKSGVDYLLVTSTPPVSAKPGAEFKYQIAARAKKGGVTFKLEAGPDGMKVTPEGAVTWAVPASAEKEANVIVTVRDAAGQETFHTFKLKVE